MEETLESKTLLGLTAKPESSTLSDLGRFTKAKTQEKPTLDYTRNPRVWQSTLITTYKPALEAYGGEIPYVKIWGLPTAKSICLKYKLDFNKLIKRPGMESGEYSFGGGKKVDWIADVDDDTVMILEFMSKSGKWDYTHTSQLRARGDYFRNEDNKKKKVYVFAIAGEFPPDEINRIHNLNIESRTATPETIAEYGIAPTYIPFTSRLEGSKTDKLAPMADPTIIKEFKEDMDRLRLNTGKNPKKIRKIKNYIPNFDKLKSAIPNEYNFKTPKGNSKTGTITLKKGSDELIVSFTPKVSFTQIHISDAKMEIYPTIINDINEIAEEHKDGFNLNKNGCSLNHESEKFNISIEMIIEKITKVFNTGTSKVNIVKCR